MSRKHYINIEKIVQASKTPLPVLRGEALNVLRTASNAYISVEDGKITDWGSMSEFSHRDEPIVDLSGKWVLPSWVDSHTHTVFAAYRSNEFEMRLEGKTYQEIGKAGGGILNSARRLESMSLEDLLEGAKSRISRMLMKGTGALEIKSGYGLSQANEMKMLAVIDKLKSWSPIPIKSTFLGAHALPSEYKSNRKAYIDLIVEGMLPQIARQNLADYCDVFCETGYFSAEEAEQIITAAKAYGIPSKIHTNQFTSIGGIQAAVKHQIKSVDHLEVMTDKDIQLLGGSETMATLLPIAPFFLNDPYPEARKMADQNVSICIATDFNPGSAPSFDMALAISLSCIKCGLQPNEAINAATINAAHAIDLGKEVGSITPGKSANFVVYPSLQGISEIPYRICSELIEDVIINGEIWKS